MRTSRLIDGLACGSAFDLAPAAIVVIFGSLVGQ
jgi:hypothetical protein